MSEDLVTIELTEEEQWEEAFFVMKQLRTNLDKETYLLLKKKCIRKAIKCLPCLKKKKLLQLQV